MSRFWRSRRLSACSQIGEHGTYLKGDMVVSNSDLQLLLSDDVFLGPVSVVFPIRHTSQHRQHEFRKSNLLGDFTALDDLFQLLDHQWANPHYTG